MECKLANSTYTAARRQKDPHPNALRSSEVSTAHLRFLQVSSVGLRAVSDVTGVSFTRLRELRSGKVTKVTRKIESRILSVTVDAYAGGANVSARRTIELVKKLRREGFTYERLARQMDLWPDTLHRLVKRKGNIRADTEMRVAKFYSLFIAEEAA
jgi:hypothetical protein